MSMVAAVERCSLGPARVPQDDVPAMRRKGRVQTGCDADLVVFDPATITDHATYLAGARPSTGYAAVLVAGRSSSTMTSFSIACPAALRPRRVAPSASAERYHLGRRTTGVRFVPTARSLLRSRASTSGA